MAHHWTLCTACIALLAAAPLARGQGAGEQTFLPVKVYSAEEDQKVLKLFDGLRVADVSDGMDMAGLPGTGLMDPAIHPLWRDDTDAMRHIIRGIAVTVRYVPTNRRIPKLTMEEFPKWEGQWYNQISPEPFVPLLRPGSVVVIDGNEDGDTGSIGSNNILGWKQKGAAGVITTGGARDTDEIILQKVPLYFRKPGRGIRPGRNEVESVNRPITVGGALVRPGDVVVADGDGVIVVPREHAEEVARAARKILDGDKAGRRRLYEQLGIPADRTVK
ncbi:MAG TPA: dimethylmenaquinone methyltransferase [Solibacterales bacterium]|nr:dimethylmenaquinone methyltransferase [Bryobacterales bacterium]